MPSPDFSKPLSRPNAHWVQMAPYMLWNIGHTHDGHRKTPIHDLIKIENTNPGN